MAVAAGAGLAYLTWRRGGHASDGGQVMETGMAGHGPGGTLFAHQIAGIRAWDERFQHRDVGSEIPVAGTGTSDSESD